MAPSSREQYATVRPYTLHLSDHELETLRWALREKQQECEAFCTACLWEGDEQLRAHVHAGAHGDVDALYARLIATEESATAL
jgi:hypothetical protein